MNAEYIMLDFAFAGDWHGNTLWGQSVIQKLSEAGVKRIYHLGDFGVWPGNSGQRYFKGLARVLEETDMEIYVTLGNHEDYTRVKRFVLNDEGWLQSRDPRYSRLKFAPRGHTWIDSGYRFASLGGAGSADRLLRTEYVDWWPEEAISVSDANLTVFNVYRRGWDRVDVLLTHEAPAGPVLQGFNIPLPNWFTTEIQHYVYSQRLLLRDVADNIMPRLNMHGHWHRLTRNKIDGINFSNKEYTCTVIGLSNENTVGNFWHPSKYEFESMLGDIEDEK